MRLENKVAVVTGGGQGLGAAISARFAEEGAKVFIAELNPITGKAAAESLVSKGCKVWYVSLDVTKEESWIACLEQVEKEAGRIDILVNNAGINIREPIETMSAEHFDAMLAVNVKGPFLGTKHVIPRMRRCGGGSIINMSSVCGLIGHKYTTEAYTITKGAVTLMTKTVAVRYAKDNIRCNSLHPSTVNTPLLAPLFKDPAKKQERIDEVPLGRLATESDVANAALYLASDEAKFINGVGLPVDGGTTAW